MHIIKFGEVNGSPCYKGRTVNSSNRQECLDLGYEIVQVPVMVDNRASFNQETPPTEGDLDYLMEIPEKTYQAGQETKQIANDLRTYDVTGEIGKDLEKHTRREVNLEISMFVNKLTIWQLIMFKIFKKKLWEAPYA